MKRIFDIMVSLSALILLSPVFAVIMILIKLESRGPIFYNALRAGKGYKMFPLLKFRTMFMNADQKLKSLSHLNQYGQSEEALDVCMECCDLDVKACSLTVLQSGKYSCERFESKKRNVNSFFKLKDDPRITRIGNFLRNTSLDEIPQLINVLRGDMSLVGNRPLPLYEAEKLTADASAARFLGPAGITGLWQVTKRGRSGDMSEEERKALDNEYALNNSFMGDIRLMLRTIPALFQKGNV